MLLSSEWMYIPHSYPSVDVLPGFALVGLPAAESDNALLVPITGHELAHVVWLRLSIKADLDLPVQLALREQICDNLDEYNELFHSSLDASALVAQWDQSPVRETWNTARVFAVRQAEELFSDFLAVALFGTAYLQAFAYLLSPQFLLPRSPEYPPMLRRVQEIVAAAREWRVPVPRSYIESFQEPPDPTLSRTERFQLAMADAVVPRFVVRLRQSAYDHVESSCQRPSNRETIRIYKRFKLLVPAESCRTLADILNAAWRINEKQGLWLRTGAEDRNMTSAFNDLVLKTIEIFDCEEVRQRLEMKNGTEE
ncbi:hypothetical protein HY374_00015 [Candidatus Berkelbacteria bacterium]|nr:hypothetical protein [Candidatus Berkelbacteria bacterium]